MLNAFGGDVPDWLRKEASELATALKADARERSYSKRDLGAISCARRHYVARSDDDLEIDDRPQLSRADNGIWVQSWVWVANVDIDRK